MELQPRAISPPMVPSHLASNPVKALIRCSPPQLAINAVDHG